MRFRQDDVEKRISDKTLLPISVTYEDTHLDDDDEYQYFDVYFYDQSTPELKKHKDDDVFRYDGYVLTPGLAKAIKTVAPYAICNEPILIEGVDGTGKEMLARSVHANCLLKGKFVLVDCGSYTAAEFESAMVGSRGKPGLVKRAEGGSLYLKDIEKLTLSMQELVLELLEPILDPDDDDEEEDDEVETQIIASCSPNIKTLLTKKQFSRDLYRALKEGYAVLPTLREHSASILPLFKQFVEASSKAPGKAGKKAKSSGRAEPYSFAKDVNATLTRLKWPGNYDDLIRSATLVSQVVAEQPGTITGAMIKECIDRSAGEKEVHSAALSESPIANQLPVIDLGEPKEPPFTPTVTETAKVKVVPALSEEEKLIRSKTTIMLEALRSGEKKYGETLGAFFKRQGLRGKYRIPVARRIVLAYALFIPHEHKLIRTLGFVIGKPKDPEDLSKCEVNQNNFTTFLAELGLKLTTIREPITMEDISPDERVWLKKLRRTTVL